jgi:hypothetical protein
MQWIVSDVHVLITHVRQEVCGVAIPITHIDTGTRCAVLEPGALEQDLTAKLISCCPITHSNACISISALILQVLKDHVGNALI